MSAEHLAGVANTLADAASRYFDDSSDWGISWDIFSKTRGTWWSEVDLFATAWNAKLPTFVSWRPKPNAWAVNAFSLPWIGLDAYAFPPFSLISRCLAKIAKEKESVTLVCPVWPGQHWYPVLLEMTADVVQLLPPSPTLLMSADGQSHPLTGSLLLAAWRVSGEPFLCEAFRRTWSGCSWQALEKPRKVLTSPPGTIGALGVWGGTPIPCMLI